MSEIRVRNTGTIKLFESDNTSHVTIASPSSLSANRTITIPDADVNLTNIATNTAKTSNATHSGEVTGATALTIADNIVDEANLKVSNTPTNGYVLSAQSGNTGGLTWVEAGGGTLVQTQKVFYESTQSTSNVTLANAFTDDYDHYVMYVAITPVSNNVELRMQFKDNSGNTVSGSNYEYISKALMSDANSTASTGESNGYIVLTDGVSSNGSDSPFIGTFWFNINRNHGSTGNMGAFNCHGQYGVRENSSSRRYRAYYHASAYRDSLTNQKARDIKLYFASGNIAQANVRIYGINGSNS